MKVAIAGYGMEGEASYEYWSQDQTNDLVIFDQRHPNRNTPAGVPLILGEDAFSNINGFDLVVRTPSLSPSKIKTDGKIWSATNEFFKKCPARIIGVTGTKGKGTTSSLIADIFKAAGYHVWLVGNIGTPALSILDKISADDIVVFELSSFQLWDLEYSPNIAVVLPVEAEHLDIHNNFDEYVAAKANICRWQKESDIVVYHAQNDTAGSIAALGGAQRITYNSSDGNGAYVDKDTFKIKGDAIANTKTLQIVGPHNYENACAAITVAKAAGIEREAIIQGLRDFQGLPYRLEYLRTVKGVDYYNDSFSSSLPASTAAVMAFNRPKIIVMGGIDRGADFDSFIQRVSSVTTIKEFVLIGKVRHKLADALHRSGIAARVTVLDETSMKGIVDYLASTAEDRDIVLLSPGYASFDMFKDFYDRGDQFTEAVMSLDDTEPAFIFQDYSFDAEKATATFSYRFTNRRELFTESIRFEKPVGDYNKMLLGRALFLAFLLVGVSYYKTFPTRRVIFSNDQYAIDEWQAQFLNQVYQEGLSQFAYENKLTRDDLAHFSATSTNEQLTHEEPGLGEGVISLQSGGKDSLLTAVLLNKTNQAFTPWYVTTSKVYPEVLSSLSDISLALATRQIDRDGLASARGDGGLNGHVPITFILQSFAVIQAILMNRRTILTSIAHEGEEPHAYIGDLAVTHQWSKTWHAELLFKEYVERYIAPVIQIGSPLRQYSELRVAELFVEHAWEQYSHAFSSCNRANYQQNADNRTLTWCGECPKCANTYLLFAPFVDAKILQELFNGQDLFEKPILQETYKGLLGVDGVMKPFECVGEIDELRHAYYMAQERGGYGKLSFAVPYARFAYREKYESQDWAKDLVKE